MFFTTFASLQLLTIIGMLVVGERVQSRDIDCLRSIKESLVDPFDMLSTWEFDNNPGDAVRNSIFSFRGVECWQPMDFNTSNILNIDLSGYGLEGEFPRGVAGCSSLTGLKLSNNMLHGSIPSDISRLLAYTSTLDLSSNRFSGEISPDMAKCAYLNTLILDNNLLTGWIPAEMSLLRRLRYFSVANNLLSGSVPRFQNDPFPGESYANNTELCGYPLDPCESTDLKNTFLRGFFVGGALFFGLSLGVGVFTPFWECIMKLVKKREMAAPRARSTKRMDDSTTRLGKREFAHYTLGKKMAAKTAPATTSDVLDKQLLLPSTTSDIPTGMKNISTAPPAPLAIKYYTKGSRRKNASPSTKTVPAGKDTASAALPSTVLPSTANKQRMQNLSPAAPASVKENVEKKRKADSVLKAVKAPKQLKPGEEKKAREEKAESKKVLQKKPVDEKAEKKAREEKLKSKKAFEKKLVDEKAENKSQQEKAESKKALQKKPVDKMALQKKGAEKEATTKKDKKNMAEKKEPKKPKESEEGKKMMAKAKRMREEMNEQKEEKKKKLKETEHNFYTRMSPCHIAALLPTLSDKQIEAVKEIGFGGFLQLNIKHMKHELISYLVQHFDYFRCTLKLEEEEMIINEDDVVSTFDLPRGSKTVKESNGLKEKDREEGYTAFLKEWRERWGLTRGGPTCTKMVEVLKTRTDCEDQFKQDFVVLVASTILKGKQDNYINFHILYAARDVNVIKEMNWCNYTIISLVSASEEWQKKGTTFFNGPSLLLILTYLDRMEFKGRNMFRHFPICSNWTLDLINERIAEEKKDGGFGRGKVVDRLRRKKDEQKTEQTSEKDDKKLSTTKITDVLGKMTDAVVEFGKTMFEIGKEDSMAGILRKAFSQFIQSEEVEEQTKELEGEEKDLDEKDPTGLKRKIFVPELEDDPFFMQPELLAALEKFERACVLPSKKKRDPGMPSFSLGLGFSDSEEQSQTVKEMGTPIDESAFMELLQESEDDLEDVMVRKRPERKYKNLPTHLRSPFWTSKNNLTTEATKKEQLISDYAFSPVTEKNKREILFKFSHLDGQKADFSTMVENEWVVNKLIDIWCLKLNIENLRRAPGQPKRIFFSTMLQIQMAFHKDDTDTILQQSFDNCIDSELEMLKNLDIEDADLVFFPVIKDSHFWIVVINCFTSQLEIIDNKPLPQKMKAADNYEGLPKKIAKHFSIYLGKRNIKLKKNVEDFKEKMLKMKWRSSSNYSDCGIYCMRHLETYKGDNE